MLNAGAVSGKDGLSVRPICWLHISDIHMRACDAWSQDVVLTAMCEHIARRRAEGMAADFILATGDLAFSGKADEYALVADFFDELCVASGIPKERIFCIPGNHDIDRTRQKLCFHGARAFLQNQNLVDALLGGGEDLKTLLIRQENYRQFQSSYFNDQNRTCTEDGLGYISRLMIEDIQLAIVGLNSAWLAEGGIDDHSRLLVGERQVINAFELAQRGEDPPHIVVGMAHHPIQLLREFDRRPAQERIERVCHFFHCGHLHEPEAHTTGPGGSGCLILAAGASFETRQSHNTFSVITLDLLQAERTVKTIQYNPGDGTFSSESTNEYRIEVAPADTCSVSELAEAIRTHWAELGLLAHYLSALLLDQKAELPIPVQDGHTFGSFAALQGQDDSELKHKTADFMAFRNVLRVLYKRVSFADMFAQHGTAIVEYGAILEELCNIQPALRDRLAEQETDAQVLARTEVREPFTHTATLLTDLANAHEWDTLREHAQRHAESPDAALAIQAKRMMALSLAHSNEVTDKKAAIELFRSLGDEAFTEATDLGNLVTLLMDDGNPEEAKATVLRGIEKFPAHQADYFSDVGQRIVKATGDRDFRKQMEAAIAKRGRRD